MDCWHQYDEDIVPDCRLVAAAMREQGAMVCGTLTLVQPTTLLVN